MPARGGAGQQGLGACRLNGGHPVGNAQATGLAELTDGGLDFLAPEGQVASLSTFEAQTFSGAGATVEHPLQPLSTEGLHEEVEQAGEGDTHDRVDLTGVGVALVLELVEEQSSNLEGTSAEGVSLLLIILEGRWC